MSKLIVVGCKLPNGLDIDLADGSTVTLLGGRVPLDEDGNPVSDRDVPGGYGLTPSVDGELMAKWLEDHKEYPPVKAGLIFIVPSIREAKAAAKDMKDVKSGLEGVPKQAAGEVTPLDPAGVE